MGGPNANPQSIGQPGSPMAAPGSAMHSLFGQPAQAPMSTPPIPPTNTLKGLQAPATVTTPPPSIAAPAHLAAMGNLFGAARPTSPLNQPGVVGSTGSQSANAAVRGNKR